MVEFQRFAEHIRDTTACLLNDEYSGCMVPYLLVIVSPRRQSQVNLGIAAGHDGVFRLTVHAQRRLSDSKFLSDYRCNVLRTVAGFDGLAEASGRGVALRAHVDSRRIGR